MKKRIYPYGIFITIEMRFFTLLMFSIAVFFLGFSLYSFLETPQLISGLASLLFLGLLIGVLWLLKYFWYQGWGVLTVTEEKIVWSCLFYKTVSIAINDIKYAEVRAFDVGNVYYNPDSLIIDHYKFVLLSDKPIPHKQMNKIVPSHKQSLIKFPLSYKLCEAINSICPTKKMKFVEYYLYLYKKQGEG